MSRAIFDFMYSRMVLCVIIILYHKYLFFTVYICDELHRNVFAFAPEIYTYNTLFDAIPAPARTSKYRVVPCRGTPAVYPSRSTVAFRFSSSLTM